MNPLPTVEDPTIIQPEDMENESGNDSDAGSSTKPARRSGRRKIKIEYIEDKNRRHITFSKRKAGIMKKAYELSTLTGTQVLLLVVSETGLVYTFTTVKLQPIVTKPEGKNLIQACLNAPDPAQGESSEADTGYQARVETDKPKQLTAASYDDMKSEQGSVASGPSAAAAAVAGTTTQQQQQQQQQPQQSVSGYNNNNAHYQPPQQVYGGPNGPMPSMPPPLNNSNNSPHYNQNYMTSPYQQQGSPQQSPQQAPYGQMPPVASFYGNQQQQQYLPPHHAPQSQPQYWPSNSPLVRQQQPQQQQPEDDKSRVKK